MTRTLRCALRLPAAERRALALAAAVQVLLAIVLRLAGLRRVNDVLAGASARRLERPPDVDAIARTLWAIDAVGRRLGRVSSCLTRALAAQWIAGRHGMRLSISIGVARGERRALDAHAWIAGPGSFQLGAAGADRYAPLVILEGQSIDERSSHHAG